MDIGITGRDIVAEKRVQVDELLKLGYVGYGVLMHLPQHSTSTDSLALGSYGKCKLCVQAPIKSNIKDPRELIGMP